MNEQEVQKKIWVVGMRFHGNHRFSNEDVLRLESEEENPSDPQAVRVMLKDDKIWKKVGYCTRTDARALREIPLWETAVLELYKRCSNSVGFLATVKPETKRELEALTETMEVLSLETKLKIIPANVRHIRSYSIDTLSEGAILKVEAIKEYTYYKSRKIMILHGGHYYHSNPFLEKVLTPLKTSPFHLRLGAFEPSGNKEHRKVTIV